MIVAMNRIPVAQGREDEFEERFLGRERRLDRVPGFLRNVILRPLQGDHYIVMTFWESMEAFQAWTRSEDFRAVHASSPPREMFSGRNVLEIGEVIEQMDAPQAAGEQR